MKNLSETIQAIKNRYQDLLPVLDERGRRLFVAAEARALGRGGAYVVEEATGMARSTINRGMKELKAGTPLDPLPRRKKGGGVKKSLATFLSCQRSEKFFGACNTDSG